MHRQRVLFWTIAVAGGVCQAWTHRFWIEPDGVNYLDIAAAYLRHDWATAINPYWSPLYSWLLAAIFYFTQSSVYWESTLLHLLNFIVFLLALRCGEFLIGELVRLRGADSLPAWALWWIGYCLLSFVSLFMVSVYLDTPDLCVSALVYLATGLLLRIQRCPARPAPFVFLGLVLGVAFLAKTVMFLIAFAFLVVAGRSRFVILSAGCFAALSLPWIIVLSHSQKRLTYGDAGWTNYCFYVSCSGSPLHPMHIVLPSPEVREFTGPIRATYPPWFNPTYWTVGLHPRFDFRSHLVATGRTGKEYLHELSGQKEFIAAFMVLLLLAHGRTTVRWRILTPVIGAMVLYGLVHVESRLIGPFFVVLWLVLFSGLSVSTSRLVIWVSLALVLATTFKVSRAVVKAPRHPTHVEWIAASGLRGLGLVPGSQVAYFGHTTEADYWAHLAGLQISADLQKGQEAEFWRMPDNMQQGVFSRLNKAGIVAIVTKSRPSSGQWLWVSGTPYSILFLQRKNEAEVGNGGQRPMTTTQPRNTALLLKSQEYRVRRNDANTPLAASLPCILHRQSPLCPILCQ